MSQMMTLREPPVMPAKPSRRRFLVGAASAASLALLPGASTAARQGEVAAEWSGHVLGAEASIVVRRSEDGPVPIEEPQAAVDLAVRELRRLEKLFSLYDPASDLARLNRTGTLFMHNSFARLMTASRNVHEWTGGAFDPTVQPLFTAMARAGGRLDPAAFEAVSRHVGLGHVGWGRNTVRLRPGMAMTLNGIAQGFAADRIAELLTVIGYPDIVVDTGEIYVGSTERAIGIPGLGGSIVAHGARNAALATTDRAGFVFSDGAGHILAPPGHADGRAWDRVTVKAKRAWIADGVSTALALAPDDAMARRLVEEGRIDAAWLHGRRGTVKIGA